MSVHPSNSISMYHLLPSNEAMYIFPKYVTDKRHIIQILPEVQRTSAHDISFAFLFLQIPRSHSFYPPSNYFPPYVHITTISYFLTSVPSFYMQSFLIFQFHVLDVKHLKNNNNIYFFFLHKTRKSQRARLFGEWFLSVQLHLLLCS